MHRPQDTADSGWQVVNPQSDLPTMLGNQLPGQSPANADVTVVVDNPAKDVPMKLHGRHANIPAMSDLKTPSTARPARAWQIIWPAFVNVIRTGTPCRYLPLVRWMRSRRRPRAWREGRPAGRPFWDDVAGELLYPALHRFGFASNRCRWGRWLGQPGHAP
jgi:hypothetical protein